MKITLNLATRPYADQGPALKRLRIGMAVLVVLLAALGFGLLHFHQAALRMRAQEDQQGRQIAAVQQEELGYRQQMQQPENAKVLNQAEFLNSLFDEKSFSWTAAMEDLERVLPGGVQVTAIEPARGKDGRLTLRLRVSGQRERAVEMVRNMERSRRFAAPRIAGENTENSGTQGNLQVVQDSGRVTFDILAEYNPATLDERKAAIAAQKAERPGRAGAVSPVPGQFRSGSKSGLGSGLTARPSAQPRIQPGISPGMRPGYIPPNGQPAGPGMGLAPGQRPGQGQGKRPVQAPAGTQPWSGGPQ